MDYQEASNVQSILLSLQMPGNLEFKLNALHRMIRVRFPSVARIGVALYDEAADQLHTFMYSADQASPLTQYNAKLSECASLVTIRNSKKPRIIHDMSVAALSDKKHARVLHDAGYVSSYTVPMLFDGHFLGFLFFNTRERTRFTASMVTELDIVSEMITLMVLNHQHTIRTLKATLKSALDITHDRDPETAEHLERMSRFSRLIAEGLAGEFEFNDQTIEHIFQFASLHDLGKIRVPDAILLKPDPLTPTEREAMKKHPWFGYNLLERLLDNHHLNQLPDISILKNIVLCHHERVDGGGYPAGLKGDDIPIEARIVSVADVFDALTSIRPYKEAWGNEKAFEYLQQQSGKQFDSRCVEALIHCKEQIKAIQLQFQEHDPEQNEAEADE